MNEILIKLIKYIINVLIFIKKKVKKNQIYGNIQMKMKKMNIIYNKIINIIKIITLIMIILKKIIKYNINNI